MTASRSLLYGETSRMHCSGVILAHSSTQTVFKSWRFHGPLLWTLFFSSFHKCSIGFKSGDWLGHSSSFTFFLWNQSRVSLAVFGIIVWLKCPPSFHLHHPGRWQQILSRMSRYIFPFILPSIIWILPVLHHDVLGWCAVPFDLQTWCVLWHPKSSIFCLIWPDYILPVFHRFV